jgi:hypothetical protein
MSQVIAPSSCSNYIFVFRSLPHTFICVQNVHVPSLPVLNSSTIVCKSLNENMQTKLFGVAVKKLKIK